jgi:predicted transglutaminase-like cysteine proteinase
MGITYGVNSASIDMSYIDKEIANHSGASQKRFIYWKKILTEEQSKSAEDKLTAVNNWFNLFAYVSDMEFEGVEDYWKSPDEFVNDGAGDCEDYAIAKYFTLLALGIPEEALKITYVKALKYNTAHMVLAYYPTPSAEPLILDNLEPSILPASSRQDLIPIYSFNAKGLWLAKQSNRDQPITGTSTLSQWQQMLSRFNK